MAASAMTARWSVLLVLLVLRHEAIARHMRELPSQKTRRAPPALHVATVSQAHESVAADVAFGQRCFRTVRMVLGAWTAAANPMAWVAQALTRFAGTRLYTRWYVRNHVTWRRRRQRIEVSRMRYRLSPRPSRVALRPAWLGLDRLAAVVDVIFLPVSLYTLERSAIEERWAILTALFTRTAPRTTHRANTFSRG